MLRERTKIGIDELISTVIVSHPVDETTPVWNICPPLTWADSRRPSRDKSLLVPVSRSRYEAPALMPGAPQDSRAITRIVRYDAQYTHASRRFERSRLKAQTMDKLITVKNLRKHFGALVAVDGIDLEVERGEVLGFLGPNGAGKSTSMKMITGFLAPTDGAISVCGHDVLTDPIAAKSRIGYLPEGAPAYGEMTPATFLRFIADIRGLSGAAKSAAIDRAVDLINLQGVLHQPIETLSKGFKRRVGLAQAILHDPEVLILDEPTDGLDPNQKHEVRSLIKQMAAQKAIVISTHILEEVDAVCSRAVIIAQGRLLFSGSPAELAAHSRYYNAVTLTIPADLEADIRSNLDALAGVATVESTASPTGTIRLTAIPDNNASIIGAVHQCVRDHDWAVDELFVEPGRLDEVFRSITLGGASSAEESRT
jgi:ABC-2 type transport system ATP-binding protein